MLLEDFIREALLLEEGKKAKKNSSSKKRDTKKGERKAASKKKTKSKSGLSGKTRTALKRIAEEKNAPLGALIAIFNKGLAAWSTGHRPGTSPQQWAFARVHSVLRGGKARKIDEVQWKQIVEYRKKKKSKK